ncbi:MAG TPA: hypothetical protein VNG51_01420 [Ktedonobacteraceae bacterium]|nr:hypothetical protein [Ktedonobacteraceae bacterium]
MTPDRDALVTLLLQQSKPLGLERIEPLATGGAYAFSLVLRGRAYRSLFLVRSSDYWEKRVHKTVEKTGQAPDLLVCWEHDSCCPVDVLALRTGDWHPAYNSRTVSVRNRYTAQVIVGQLLCGLQAAYDDLADYPEGTKYRYLAKVAELSKRERGRPLKI